MTYADMFAEVKGMFMEADVSDISKRREIVCRAL